MAERRNLPFAVLATLLFLFSLALLGFHTGRSSLWDIDEPNNAQALKEMVAHHNLIVPTFNGELRPDKPILNYWLMWAGTRLFGFDPGGLRAGSVFMGALTALLLAVGLRRLIGAEAALLAGLLFATCLHAQIIFRAAVPDPLLIFFVTASLLLWLRGYLHPDERGRSYLTAYGAMAFATLTKGPVGFLLPGLIIVLFLLARRDLPHLWRQGRLAAGIPLFLIIALPWYIAVGLETHWAWDLAFIGKQNVGRYLDSMQGHKGPIYYYLATVPLGLLPWSIFLPQVFLGLWRKRHHMASRHPTETFLLIWAVTWIAFFSIAATKLPNYVLEAYPPLLILIALRLREALQGESPLQGRGLSLSLIALLVVGAALAAAGQWWVPREEPHLPPMWWLGIPYLLAAAFGLFFAWRRRPGAVLGSLGGGAVLLTGVLVLMAMPALDRLKPSPAMGRIIAAIQGERPYALAAWRWFQPSFLYYGGRGAMPVHLIPNPAALAGVVRDGGGTAYLALPAKAIPELGAQLPKGLGMRTLYEAYELYNREDIALVQIRPLAPSPDITGNP